MKDMRTDLREDLKELKAEEEKAEELQDDFNRNYKKLRVGEIVVKDYYAAMDGEEELTARIIKAIDRATRDLGMVLSNGWALIVQNNQDYGDGETNTLTLHLETGGYSHCAENNIEYLQKYVGCQCTPMSSMSKEAVRGVDAGGIRVNYHFFNAHVSRYAEVIDGDGELLIAFSGSNEILNLQFVTSVLSAILKYFDERNEAHYKLDLERTADSSKFVRYWMTLYGLI